MPSAGRPRARGPLPAHVAPHIYRRRRLVVVSVAVLLVFGLGRVLSWSSDGSGGGDGDTASQAAADTTPSAAESTKKGEGKKDCKGKSKFRGGDKENGKRKACQGTSPDPTPTPTPTPPAVPTGPCPESDLYITPSLPDPVAGRDVTILLNLQMGVTEACTWRVSPDSAYVKVYAGADDVWSTRECEGAFPTADVVVRRDAATPVTVVWDSKRSDEYCTGRTAWALPGPYGAAASAFGGEATHVAFELLTPVPAVVTQTAEPTQQPDPTPPA